MDYEQLIEKIVPKLDRRLFGREGVWMIDASTGRTGFIPYDKIQYHQIFALSDTVNIMRECKKCVHTIAVLMLRPPKNPRLYQIHTEKYFSHLQ